MALKPTLRLLKIFLDGCVVLLCSGEITGFEILRKLGQR